MNWRQEFEMRERSGGEEENRRKLEELRRRIDETDDEIAEMLSRRIRLALSIRNVKKALNIPISDEDREREVIEKWMARGKIIASVFNANKYCKIEDVCTEMFARIGAEIVKYTLQIEEKMDCVERERVERERD